MVFHSSKSVLHVFLWSQMNSYGFYSSELDFYGSRWVFMVPGEFSWFSCLQLGFYAFSWFHMFFMVSLDFHGFSWFQVGFP